MQKLLLFIFGGTMLLLLSSCSYVDYTTLGKMPNVSSKHFLQHMSGPGMGLKLGSNSLAQENSRKKFFEELGDPVYLGLTVDETNIRKKITTEFFKKLRTDYRNQTMSCEDKQLNLEKYFAEYLAIAKERDWINYSVIIKSSSIEKHFQGLIDMVSYPCSKIKKNALRTDIELGRQICFDEQTSSNILCKNARDNLEKYDKQFLNQIDTNGIETVLNINKDKYKNY